MRFVKIYRGFRIVSDEIHTDMREPWFAAVWQADVKQAEDAIDRHIRNKGSAK
jgi:hypothetical protein